MTKLFTTATIAICLGATATLAITNSNASLGRNQNQESRMAADGAFRDGLYLGKLSAERGQPLRPAIGRWSTGQDRSTFAAGYRRGYAETLARANSDEVK
ncbi:MAG TPA: hypothetical protein VN310_12395 [Candidatus Dormibacteraeota bacterium]|jgi:hypothetical protein|nr:hypothetical protein [Candidatus Dormibacteraeota bacterium]